MEDNAGAWTLTSLGPTRTRVFYQAHADPGGSIPTGMVNWAAPRTIADLFASVRKAAARGQLSASRK